MNERTTAGAENKDAGIERNMTAEYPGGLIDYSVVGETKVHNPVLIVPGFTEGRAVFKNFSEVLSREGERQVIYPDQPEIDRSKRISIVDHHARALLGVIKAEGLQDTPVDIIAHSFGALVAARLAFLAKSKKLDCFNADVGSHSVLIAPAGSNDKENLFFLGGRFVHYLYREGNPLPGLNLLARQLDPTGEYGKAGQKNFFSHPAKTVSEIIEISKKPRIYRNLGAVGLRPHVFGYATDVMYPHKVVKTVMEANGDAVDGYSMPIDNDSVGAASFDEFKLKTGLSGKGAKKAWAHHYRNAGHNDFLFHPERTVKAILEIWDGNKALSKV